MQILNSRYHIWTLWYFHLNHGRFNLSVYDQSLHQPGVLECIEGNCPIVNYDQDWESLLCSETDKMKHKNKLQCPPTALKIHTHQLFLINAEHYHALALLSEAISEWKAPWALTGTVLQRQKAWSHHSVTKANHFLYYIKLKYEVPLKLNWNL